MRTTFFEIRLFNDTSQMHNAPFIQNGKEWGESQIEEDRERERTDEEFEAVCSGERVAALVINLAIGQVFMLA
jgi:hypothetical protein